MSKWIERLLFILVGLAIYPAILLIGALHGFAMETGPSVAEEVFGWMFFIVLLIALLALFAICLWVYKLIQQKNRQKRVAKSEDKEDEDDKDEDGAQPIKAKKGVTRVLEDPKYLHDTAS